jgi:hypothetical protein
MVLETDAVIRPVLLIALLVAASAVLIVNAVKEVLIEARVKTTLTFRYF